MINNINKIQSHTLSIVMLLAAFCMAGLAQAASSLYSATGFNDTNYSITFAMEFTPQADIEVTHLGVFDAGVDGPSLGTPHDVALWQNDGTLLASTTVNDADPQTGGFHYVPITPVTLSAGQTYVLGAYYPFGMPGDKLVASTAPTTTPFVTINTGSRYAIGPALAFPDSSNPDFRIAANLLFAPVDTSAVNIDGTVKTSTGTDICAMVLANGKYMFSCNPVGVYALGNLPRDSNGIVKLQVYASGFLPYKTLLIASGTTPVTMTPAGTCPDYNPPGNPGYYPGSAGQWIDISGSVFVMNGTTQTPVCAMVLANGQHMFSCAGAGAYSLHVPLDSNGQVKLQIYADGFAPYNVRIDAFQTVNDIQLARASECQ